MGTTTRGVTGIAEEHRRLARKEISTSEYVRLVKENVNRRLGIEPSKMGRVGRPREGRAA